MIDNFEIRAYRRMDLLHGISLIVFRRDPSSKLAHVVTDVVLEEIPEGGLYPPSPFILSESEAQGLMNDLYRMGFRPSDQADIEGVRAHLQDMRTIAFHKLGIKDS